MKAPLAAGLGLALAAVPARPATVSPEVEPLSIEGFYLPQQGPSAATAVTFKRPGWVRGFSVHLENEGGKSADSLGIFCHSAFFTERDRALENLEKTLDSGYRPEVLRLTTAEGQNEVVLPKGFGLPVEAKTPYVLEVALQNQRAENFGRYNTKVQIDVVYKGDGPPLKPLHGLAVSACPVGMKRCRWIAPVEVPPGVHERRQEFVMPYSGTAHYIAVHLHQFTDRVALVDPRSGKTLFSANVKNRADGWPEQIPVYSDVKGIPLKGGERYEFLQHYRNPLSEVLEVMSIMRLYVHRDGAAD